MLRFVVRRTLASLPVIFGVTTLVFLLLHFVPGDPVDIMLGDSAAAADREQLRFQLGLTLPLWKQYLLFWSHIFDGTWGQSLARQISVLQLILERFPSTLLLAIVSLSLAVLFSFPLGVLAARKAGSWIDSLAMGIALLGMSLPIFVMAPVAVLLFSIQLRWLPVSGSGSLAHLVLPAVCLAAGLSGILTRIVRTSVLESLGEDFVRTARSKGLSEIVVMFRHTLSNAMIPIITILGNMLGGLLAGAVLTESLFDWPGLGRLFYSAFQARDFPLVQGIVLWISVTYVVISVVIDVLYSVFDPRIRLEG